MVYASANAAFAADQMRHLTMQAVTLWTCYRRSNYRRTNHLSRPFKHGQMTHPLPSVFAAQVWDFPTCRAESHMTGHGGDVKGCDWHPDKAVIASGSKDGLVKVWDAKAGRNIATLHGHRNTVMETLWNANGNWLLSACRDQSLKVHCSLF